MASQRKQTICLNMIVKDESKCIKECLDSVYKYIDYYVISDTGSSDNTIEIIKEFFEDKNIKGEIHQNKWKNFGYNRTLALKLCEGKSDYIFIIDADDKLVGDLKLPDVLDKDVYYMNLKSGNSYYKRRQLFRNLSELDWKYIGVLHEYCHSEKAKTDGSIEGDYYVDSRRIGNRNKNPKKKYEDDALLLEKALKEEPNNDRYQFYLAQSYFDCGQYEKSKFAYQKRVEMGGWYEEVFYSYYRTAMCIQNLNQPEEEVVAAYMAAYDYLPSRIESFYQLARYFRLKEDFEKAYIYSKKGLGIPYPKDQILFISKDVYDYQLWDEFSIAAYYMGKFYESYYYCDQILKKECVKDQATLNRISDSRNFAVLAIEREIKNK